MMRNNSIQLYLRKYNYQIFSKLILTLYSIFLVVSGVLLLPPVIYIVAIILFLVVNYSFFKYPAYRNKSHLIDLAIVFSLLYGSSLDSFLTYPYLLFPLVCRGTYLDRFSYDRYFILEYLLLLVLLNLSVERCDLRYYLWQMLPVGIYILLNGMSVMRMRYDEKRIQLLDITDDYFIQQSNSYEVYRHIIKYLKDQGINVSNMCCMECDVNMKRPHLVNSSYLLSSCYLRLSSRDIKSLQNGMIVNNVDFSIDGKRQKLNEVYPVFQSNNNSSNLYFLFIISFNPETINFKHLNLEPLFLRMARLISFERIIRKRRDASIQDMLQKSKFVSSATNTMHFLKNRLTPLQTLIDLVKNEGGVKQLEEYDELLLDAAHSAQKEMNVILTKAEYLLNKQNNPFVFAIDVYDAHSIFTTLGSVWSNAFPTLLITTVTNDASEGVVYETNIEGLEILFSDIVGNMIKYSKSVQRCEFIQQEDSTLIVTFENDFGSKNDVLALINDVNNPNKDAVIYRTSYGVSNIRAITDNLSIGLQASLKTNESFELYHLELKFTAEKNEDTNH